MKHFNKSQNAKTLTQKFDYIKQHFTYNNTIANNIKLYMLPLTKEQLNHAYTLMGDEDCCAQIWNILAEYCIVFEEYHNNYKVYSEGRQNGYLTLNATKYAPSLDIIDIYMEQSTSYKDYVATLHNAYGGSYVDAQNEARQQIENIFDLVVAFDDLCDNMLTEFIRIIGN